MSVHPRKLRNDCFLTDSDRLTHEAALSTLRRSVSSVAGSERVALKHAAGRVLAEAVTAPRPVPGHDNAAVDGYAFRFQDYDPSSGTTLPVSGRSAAGHPLSTSLQPGTAVRILTGAVMPETMDSVVMQEDVEPLEDKEGLRIFIPSGLKEGANRRRSGEDVATGDVLVPAGQVLRPQDLAAIASAGYGEVVCFARLKVAIIASGDEVLEPGAAFQPGKVL